MERFKKRKWKGYEIEELIEPRIIEKLNHHREFRWDSHSTEFDRMDKEIREVNKKLNLLAEAFEFEFKTEPAQPEKLVLVPKIKVKK